MEMVGKKMNDPLFNIPENPVSTRIGIIGSQMDEYQKVLVSS
jgi:hypothetical protein